MREWEAGGGWKREEEKRVKDPGKSVFVKNEKYWHCKCTLEGKSSCFIGGRKIGYVLFHRSTNGRLLSGIVKGFQRGYASNF